MLAAPPSGTAFTLTIVTAAYAFIVWLNEKCAVRNLAEIRANVRAMLGILPSGKKVADTVRLALNPGSATVAAAWMPAGRRRSQNQAVALQATTVRHFI
jgi:hypothetical protein